MSEDTIPYELLAQEAMRGVIRLALLKATEPDGLPGNHHFFISFITQHPGVEIPDRLVDEYPEEMTIIIKRHFWDLDVRQDGFSVSLSFNNLHEHIQVSYAAVTRFIDPEAPFALQFPSPERPTPSVSIGETSTLEDGFEGSADVVSLDAFRKR